jgi:hypothetical protein
VTPTTSLLITQLALLTSATQLHALDDGALFTLQAIRMLMKLLLKTMTAILSPGKHLMRQQPLRCVHQHYAAEWPLRCLQDLMALAGPLRKVASKLMAKFGGTATIRRVVAGAYNPTTGTVSETTTDTAVRGVLEDVNLREVNDLIQAGDKRLLIAAADIANPPTTADEAIIEGVTYQTVQVRTIEQDNTAITYELILRA